jgi:1,4-dihydroxy-2-naphthoyl-CoA synthase
VSRIGQLQSVIVAAARERSFASDQPNIGSFDYRYGSSIERSTDPETWL